VSTVRKSNEEEVIAILCADIHLSLNPPIWRSAEKDWFEAMKRPLNELASLSEKYKCPIICAGDVFDKWNSPPELINFALDYLPPMIAIPGQHDIPNHNSLELYRGAFWTLVKAKKIRILKGTDIVGGIEIRSFDWEEKIISNKQISGYFILGVAHQYVWIPEASYPDAPLEKKLDKGNTSLKGYDIFLFGDNHKGFTTHIRDTVIFNPGTLMRRKSDEIDYRPQVGLLTGSGSVINYYLSISKDKYLDVQNITTNISNFDMASFFRELEKLGDSSLDFTDMVKQYLETHSLEKGIRTIILKAIGDIIQ